MSSEIVLPSAHRKATMEEIEYDGGMSKEIKGLLIGMAAGTAAFGLIGTSLGYAVYNSTLSISAAVKVGAAITLLGTASGGALGFAMGYREHYPQEEYHN